MDRPCLATENTIKVGVVLPLTGSRARLGTLARNATELAIKRINTSVGIEIGGKKYTVEAV